MKNINKILAVSLVAMLAVPAAHAKIVSETMLSSQAGHYSGSHTVQSEIDAKQDTLVVSGANKNIAGANGITVSNEEGVITITGNSSDVSGLASRVTTAEGEIDALQETVGDNTGGLVKDVADLQNVTSDLGDLATKDEVAESDLASALANKINGKVDANSAITGATKTKITYDSKGLVTAGADLEASDIPSLATSKVTALTGYAKGSSSDPLATDDSLNAALGKLENKADNAAAAAASASSTAASTYQIKSTADYQMGKAGGGWTTMSDAQKGALDSGITSAGVTQITTNKNAITTLNGNDQTTGSVAKTVKDAIDNLNLANTYQAKGDYAAASHNHASQDVNAMTGYAKAQTAAAIEATDSLNTAIGKLEKKVDDAGSAATTPASASAAGVAKLYTSTGNNTDGSMTQKAVTDALGNKQDTISDLSTIRSGAAAGATALQPASITASGANSYKIVTYGANGLVTGGKSLEAADIPTIAESQVTNLTTDLAAKQTTANMVTATENLTSQQLASTTTYPSMATADAMLNAKTETLTENVTYLMETMPSKQDKLGNSNVVVDSQNGSGNVVTAVTANNGVVTVAKSMTAIPEPSLPADTAGTLVLTATPNQAGTGFVYHWEDLGR